VLSRDLALAEAHPFSLTQFEETTAPVHQASLLEERDSRSNFASCFGFPREKCDDDLGRKKSERKKWEALYTYYHPRSST
jgi:hypothetical protein